MTLQTRKSLLIALLTASILSTAVAGTSLPFVDSFNNNSVPDADTQPGFWGTFPIPLPSSLSVQEAAGKETLITSSETGTHLIGTSLTPDFNFFQGPLTFTISGLTLTGTASSAGSVFQFAVQDAANKIASAADAATIVSLTGDNHLTLSLSAPNYFPNGPAINNILLQGAATGFSLTLNASVNGGGTYSLLVNEGSGSQTFTGTLPTAFSQANWGSGGASALSLAVLNKGGLTNTVTGIVDEVSVTSLVQPVPEPSTWCAAALSLAAIAFSQRRRFRPAKRLG